MSDTGAEYKVCLTQGWSTKCVSHRVVAQTVSNTGAQSDTRVGYKLTIFLGLWFSPPPLLSNVIFSFLSVTFVICCLTRVGSLNANC